MLVGVGILYFAVGWLGSGLGRGFLMEGPIALPTGLALGAVLLLGARIWPALMFGAFATAFVMLKKAPGHTTSMVAACLGITLGNTVEPLIGAWLANRFANGRKAFEQPSTVLLFFGLTAILSTIIAPGIGLTTFLLAGYQMGQEAQRLFFGWWFGNMASAILLTPLIVVWSTKRMPVLNLKRTAEAIALLLLLLLSCRLVFSSSLAQQTGGAPLTFLITPFLLWTAMRFGQRGTTAGAFLVACIATISTMRGQGAFALVGRQYSLLLLQNFIVVATVMALILAADVAQRRRSDAGLSASEQRYRQLFEDNPQPMWVFDYETLCFLDANKAATRHYGYSREEFLGMTLPDLHVEAEITALQETVPKARKGIDTRVRWSHRKKDGGVIEVELARQNVLFEGRPAAVVLSTDITAQKQAEQEILRLNTELERRVRERTRQLEAINKELEAFSYSVSHDLRAPLRSIRGFSEVLLERYSNRLDARGREFLRRACESSQHMDRLIEDLLKLSRVGRSELQRQEVDLSTVCSQIAAELQHSEPKRSVDFVITPGLKALADERLLRIVLDNLLRNAWKFTGKKRKARIEFGVTEQRPKAFFIRDDGAGFDMAYADRLFGVFQRLHSSNEFPGTGVGLATVQRIINRHGGRAWAESGVERGATFYFTLPSNGTLDALWAWRGLRVSCGAHA